MTTTPFPTHTAFYVRYTDTHFHQHCVPSDYTPQFSDVQLDMSNRANIEQCREVTCYACNRPLYLFSDRKEVVLKQWPDAIIQTIEQANLLADSVIGKTVLGEDGKDYTILHAWVIIPDTDNDKPGQIMALCELVEDDEEREQEQPATPALSTPLARERFTPPPWTVKHVGGRCYSLHVPQRDNYMVAMAFSEADARLIAEAPNMFALLKEFMTSDYTYDDSCTCYHCQAVRLLVARVLGEETK